MTLSFKEQCSKWKAEIEITGEIIRILAISGNANEPRGDGLRRTEGSEGENGEHP